MTTLALVEHFEENGFNQQNFQNARDNRIGCYVFSAPLTLDIIGAESFHQRVGKDNFIRQNVEMDPVPNVARVFNCLTHIGLSDYNYQPTGHLALDSSVWAMRNAIEASAETACANVQNGNASPMQIIQGVMNVVTNPIQAILAPVNTTIGCAIGVFTIHRSKVVGMTKISQKRLQSLSIQTRCWLKAEKKPKKNCSQR